jgi:hypothetical protein
MTTRRNFLKALVAVPLAPVLLRGMDWATPTAAELVGEHKPAAYSAEVPTGTILPYVSEATPPGFLPCDGRSVPRFMFPKLHGAIGDAFGKTSPLTVRLPDMRVKARPAAALAADRRDIAAGMPPAYMNFRYVIKT